MICIVSISLTILPEMICNLKELKISHFLLMNVGEIFYHKIIVCYLLLLSYGQAYIVHYVRTHYEIFY